MQHEIFPAALRARARHHGLAVSVEPIYTDPDLAIYGYAGSMRRPPVRSDLRPTLSPSSVGSIGTGVIWKFHTIRFSLVVSDVESVDGASTRPALHAVEAPAQRLGVQVLTVPVRRPEDLDGAVTMMVRERVTAWRGNCGSPSRRSAIGTVGFWPRRAAR